MELNEPEFEATLTLRNKETGITYAVEIPRLRKLKTDGDYFDYPSYYGTGRWHFSPTILRKIHVSFEAVPVEDGRIYTIVERKKTIDVAKKLDLVCPYCGGQIFPKLTDGMLAAVAKYRCRNEACDATWEPTGKALLPPRAKFEED